MFIKLTRKDGSFIWLNGSFVVTVEPVRSGGAIVVPVGDGLDYEVRESPEEVLSLLAAAPAPAIVPVPTSDALTSESAQESREPAPERPVAASPSGNGPVADAPAAEGKPAKRTRTAKKAKDGADAEKKPAKTRTRASRKAPLDLAPEHLDRLKKLSPKTLKKLLNTLATQFTLEDPDATVKALTDQGVIALDQDRVMWNTQAE